MNKKVSIAVLVSGGGTNLQALIDAERAGKIKSGQLRLVVSNKEGAYALCRAQKAGIETKTITKADAGTQKKFEENIISALEEKNIGLVVLAGFLSILSPMFISKYKDRIINVHPSLIPSFCGKGFYGLRVHEAALEYGVKVTGATVHYVNEIPDGGEIILQKAVKVKKNDTPESLQLSVMENAEWKILPQAVEIASKKILKKVKKSHERV